MTNRELSRRTFGGVVVAGAAAPLLVACGSDDAPSGAEETTPAPSGAEETTPATPADGSGSGSGGGGLVATSEVPVGGGLVVKDQEVVVTQPAQGDFKAFTAVCTHQGCLVGSVSDGQIQCPCHGSAFSVEDGSVVNGPASSPLEEVPVTVTAGQVTRS